ncbi:hypothetical protein DFH07DRAFT_786082 [Mycena maculata]|uniref:Uncharacterized protein n=1 Tax=Mycena maculata TaxID=230809 RepID=A0AAD7P1Q5_9AGAR|nr:hypothetical protein DFH07DRAFT_786082 [Mycena maculata]
MSSRLTLSSGRWATFASPGLYLIPRVLQSKDPRLRLTCQSERGAPRALCTCLGGCTGLLRTDGISTFKRCGRVSHLSALFIHSLWTSPSSSYPYPSLSHLTLQPPSHSRAFHPVGFLPRVILAFLFPKQNEEAKEILQCGFSSVRRDGSVCISPCIHFKRLTHSSRWSRLENPSPQSRP